MTADHGAAAPVRPVPPAFREPGPEPLSDLLRWHRIPGGIRYLRRHGVMALLRRLLPELRTYSAWVRLFDTLNDDDRKVIRAAVTAIKDPPLISLLMPVYDTPEPYLQQAIASVLGQLYPHWELCIADNASRARRVRAALEAHRLRERRIKVCFQPERSGDAAACNSALALADGRFVALLRPEDILPEHALYMIAAALAQNPDLDLIFSDEDRVGSRGKRFYPLFKSDWNPDLMLSHNAVGDLAVYRRSLIKEIGGFRDGYEGSEDYDLALRVAVRTTAQRIYHIPRILYHRRKSARPKGAAGARRAIADHLAETGLAGEVLDTLPSLHRVRLLPPDSRPGVSVIIPTRDRVDLVRQCLDGLRHKTDYDALEIIVVDNDSVEPRSRAYFTEISALPGVRVLPYPGTYNYSAINNFAVRHARNEIIALLNNDIEIIHPDWLQEMVSHVVRPEVGAVGAKLYYPDDRVQHAGTVIGLGGAAGHLFRLQPRNDPGYAHRLCVVQNLSAVTAACMLFRRAVFDEVGGLDEVNLPIAFNDVDLCLKMREKGYRIVWTPHAELYHWESVSRGNDFDPDKIERFRREMKYLQQRWSAVIAHDPYYNPNLTVEANDCGLAFPPRGAVPWLPQP